MSLRTRSLSAGALRGTIYTFDDGDVLPMHRHTDVDAHITIVARGRFRVHGPVIGEKEYGEGTVLDWMPGVDHEFVALSRNARIVNIIKGVA